MFGVGAHGVEQRALDLAAGDVAGVDDAPLAVPALAAELELPVAVARETARRVSDSQLDRRRRLARADLDDRLVAEARARDERVLDVRLERVVGRQHRGDAALGPARVGFVARRAS